MFGPGGGRCCGRGCAMIVIAGVEWWICRCFSFPRNHCRVCLLPTAWSKCLVSVLVRIRRDLSRVHVFWLWRVGRRVDGTAARDQSGRDRNPCTALERVRTLMSEQRRHMKNTPGVRSMSQRISWSAVGGISMMRLGTDLTRAGHGTEVCFISVSAECSVTGYSP